MHDEARCCLCGLPSALSYVCGDCLLGAWEQTRGEWSTTLPKPEPQPEGDAK